MVEQNQSPKGPGFDQEDWIRSVTREILDRIHPIVRDVTAAYLSRLLFEGIVPVARGGDDHSTLGDLDSRIRSILDIPGAGALEPFIERALASDFKAPQETDPGFVRSLIDFLEEELHVTTPADEVPAELRYSAVEPLVARYGLELTRIPAGRIWKSLESELKLEPYGVKVERETQSTFWLPETTLRGAPLIVGRQGEPHHGRIVLAASWAQTNPELHLLKSLWEARELLARNQKGLLDSIIDPEVRAVFHAICRADERTIGQLYNQKIIVEESERSFEKASLGLAAAISGQLLKNAEGPDAEQARSLGEAAKEFLLTLGWRLWPHATELPALQQSLPAAMGALQAHSLSQAGARLLRSEEVEDHEGGPRLKAYVYGLARTTSEPGHWDEAYPPVLHITQPELWKQLRQALLSVPPLDPKLVPEEVATSFEAGRTRSLAFLNAWTKPPSRDALDTLVDLLAPAVAASWVLSDEVSTPILDGASGHIAEIVRREGHTLLPLLHWREGHPSPFAPFDAKSADYDVANSQVWLRSGEDPLVPYRLPDLSDDDVEIFRFGLKFQGEDTPLRGAVVLARVAAAASELMETLAGCVRIGAHWPAGFEHDSASIAAWYRALSWLEARGQTVAGFGQETCISFLNQLDEIATRLSQSLVAPELGPDDIRAAADMVLEAMEESFKIAEFPAREGVAVGRLPANYILRVESATRNNPKIEVEGLLMMRQRILLDDQSGLVQKGIPIKNPS